MSLLDFTKPQYNMAGGRTNPQGFDIQSLISNPLLHAGVGLLSSKKGEGAQAALQGLMQGQQLRQSFSDRAKKDAEDKRLQDLSAKLPGLFASGGTQAIAPELMGNPETMALGLKAAGVGAGTQSIPASLQELAALQNMTPEQQDQFWKVKRAQQTFGAGGVQYGIDPRTQAVAPLVDPNQVAQTAATIKGAEAGAATTAKTQAEATAQAPQAVESANNMLTVLDKAINHPGRKLATGFSSVFNPVQPAGSSARDFLTVADQLKGSAFLQAFESLKGGGQITQVEGEKATQAIARLNEAQSEGEYLKALKDFRAIIQRGKERAEGRLGSSDGAVNWSDL